MHDHQTILIIEDEPALSSLLGDYLRQAGYEAGVVNNGNDAIKKIRSTNPDLVLLDLMLPGKDGMQICREIRQFSNMPVIMITARVEEIDRLLGLELGADDYICKPFSPREVVARVKAVLRRYKNEWTNENKNDFVVEVEKQKVIIDGHSIELTAVEFELFKILHGDPGRIYSRSQLMDRIYRDHRIVSERTIDSHIKKLRKKISNILPDREVIYSIYGVGYKFEPE